VRLPTVQGSFDVYARGDGVLVAGTIALAGQGYELTLRLRETEDGWIRHDPDDLVMTKTNGANVGKPARPIAREFVINFLPEAVNAFLTSDAGQEVVQGVHRWTSTVQSLRSELADVEQQRKELLHALEELGAA